MQVQKQEGSDKDHLGKTEKVLASAFLSEVLSASHLRSLFRLSKCDLSPLTSMSQFIKAG